MKKSDLELKTLDIISRVQSKLPLEDSAVELKATWPSDHPKTARQLAAHANAMRGEPILWLIGIDQETGVVGADEKELSTWMPSVASQFGDQVAPVLLLNIAVPSGLEGKVVVALYFESDRIPYVVKNPAFGKRDGGPVELEVPWREGNSTRTARRPDLLRLLVPVARLPMIEILGADLECKKFSDTTELTWAFRADLYVVPRSESPIYLPFHRARGYFYDSYSKTNLWFRDLKIGIDATGSVCMDGPQVSIRGPGKFAALGSVTTPHRSSGYPSEAQVHLILGLADSDETLPVTITMQQERTGGTQLRWAQQRPSYGS